MAMELRLARDGSLISNQIHYSSHDADHILNRLKTLTNVSYVQPQGRMEWGFVVIFLFCDLLPGSSIARMQKLVRQSHRKEWFRFTYKDGKTYDVRVVNPINPSDGKDEESGPTDVYYIEAILLKRGWEV